MEVEAPARERILERHALAGVTFPAPDTVAVDADVEIGADTEDRSRRVPSRRHPDRLAAA